MTEVNLATTDQRASPIAKTPPAVAFQRLFEPGEEMAPRKDPMVAPAAMS
jgi:hypothetical protein